MVTIPFKPRRFRSTAEYYAKYRVPYPADLIEAVAARVGLRPGDRVLDLGCGPAMLAIGFSRLGMAATAMDPEPEMLDAARNAVDEARVMVDVMQGSSYDLGPHLGRFRLVTMGRSFHWMDRSATLATLDRLIEQGGAVALFHDRRVSSTGDWQGLLTEAAEQYAVGGGDGRATRRSPDWEPHEVMLVGSPFSHIETMGRVFPQVLGVDDVLGRAYSMSASSLEALGANQPAFEAAVRKGLAAISAQGRFTEIVETEAMIAFRSPEPAAQATRQPGRT